MKHSIPWALITLVSRIFSNRYSHFDLNNIFKSTNATWDIKEESKAKKIEDWLVSCNNIADDPLFFLGKIIERYMDGDMEAEFFLDREFVENYNEERKKFKEMLARYGLRYMSGGVIIPIDTLSSSFSLKTALEGKSYNSLKIEVERALTAAAASIEAFCKIYLEQHNLPLPKDQSIKPLWAEVAKSLGLEPACLEDNDLKRILGGLSPFAME